MKNETRNDKVYSIDGEEWVDDIPYLIENLENNVHTEVMIGKTEYYRHTDFIDTEILIENAKDNAYHLVDDVSDDYLEDITKQHIEELNELICDYLNKHIEEPEFFRVVDINKISVDEFREIARGIL
jgi:hypothetical protein